MNKCTRCDVYVDDSNSSCPLCGRLLIKDKQKHTTAFSYPSYDELNKPKKMFTARKLLLIILVAVIITSVTVNAYTYSYYKHLWSGLTSMVLIYAWITVNYTILKRGRIGGKILSQFTMISIVLFAIDLYIGFGRWSVNYVIPFMAVCSTLLTTVLALSKGSQWHDYLGFLLATFFISVCPILFFLFRLSTVAWPSVISVLYSLITGIALYIIGGRKFKEEIGKRFHT